MLTNSDVIAVKNNNNFNIMIEDGGGLWLQVTPTQSKSWLFILSFQGQLQGISLGSTDNLSLDQARDLGRRCADMAKDGAIPTIERRSTSALNDGLPRLKGYGLDIIEAAKIGWKPREKSETERRGAMKDGRPKDGLPADGTRTERRPDIAEPALNILHRRFSARSPRRDLFAWVDSRNRAVARVDQYGRLRARPALGDNRACVEAGARGAPMAPVDHIESTTYWSDIRSNGVGLAPYTYRRNPPYAQHQAHPIATSRKMCTFLDYGQSWRGTWGKPSPQYQNLGLQEMVHVLRNRWGSIPNTYFPPNTEKIEDIFGVRTEGEGGITDTGAAQDVNTGGGAEIGIFAGLTFQKLCAMNGALIQPVLTFGQPLGGSSWSQAYRYDTDKWLAPGSAAWSSLVNAIRQVPECLAPYNLEPEYCAVGFSHGAYQWQALGVYYDELVDIVRQFQLLGLPTGGRRLHFFTDQTACYANDAVSWVGMLDQVRFANERSDFVHCIGPRYPYPLRDGVHHTADATADIGVLEGYVKYLVLRCNYAWTPLQITDWTVSGHSIVVTLSNPWGAHTGVTTVVQDTTTIDAAENSGFQLIVGGINRTITSISISGMTIVLTYGGAVATGDVELQYAWKRDAKFADLETRSGVWGNIKQVGPTNPLWNGGNGKTVDAWLCTFNQTKTF